jgi:hypothetical protein
MKFAVDEQSELASTESVGVEVVDALMTDELSDGTHALRANAATTIKATQNVNRCKRRFTESLHFTRHMRNYERRHRIAPE